MTPVQREALLASLSNEQAGEPAGHGTAPISIQIGHVTKDHQVAHDTLRIMEASQSIVEHVFAWVARERSVNPDAGYVQAFIGDGALIIRLPACRPDRNRPRQGGGGPVRQRTIKRGRHQVKITRKEKEALRRRLGGSTNREFRNRVAGLSDDEFTKHITAIRSADSA